MTESEMPQAGGEPGPEQSSYGAGGYGYSGSDANEQPFFWYYLDMMIRRIWVILTVLVIVLTIGVVKAFRDPSVYQATVRVLVEKSTPRLMQFQGLGPDYYSWDPDFYNTQAGIVKSRAVLEIVLQDPAVSNIFQSAGRNPPSLTPSVAEDILHTAVAAMGVAPASPPEPWEVLRRYIRADALKNTHFISVTVEYGDPEKAALLANAVARAFEQYNFKEKVDLLGESFGFLQKEKDKEEKAVASAEAALKAFLEKTPGLSLSEAGGASHPAIQRMNELNAEIGRVNLARIDALSDLESMRSITPSSDADVEASRERLFSSPVVRKDTGLMALRGKMEEAEKTMLLLSNTYGMEHPLYRTAETNIMLLRSQFKEGFRLAVTALEKDVKLMEEKEGELLRQYDEEKKKTVGLTSEANVYIRLKSEVDRHRRLYESLVSRLLEVDISSGLVQGNVKVVDRAKVPAAPVRPDRLRIVLFSLLIGLFLGCSLAFVFENLDYTIKTPEDLKERLGLPLLGFIPVIKEARVAPAGTSAAEPSASGRSSRKRHASSWFRKFLAEFFRGVIPAAEEAKTAHEPIENIIYRSVIVAAESDSSVTEAYRHIRTNLFFSVPANEVKVLVVTSCQPREGKTTTCANLATIIAQAGRNVLLVDADLHRRMVRRIFDLPLHAGLTNVLTGEVAWQEAVQVPVVNGAPIDHLHVLGAGTRSPNPAELIGAQVMREFLVQVRAAYDWVIIDTPPALFVSDASVLGAMADGVILVVKSGTSARSLLFRAKEQLLNVKAKIVGTILNNMTVTRLGRHYSYYYYHGYARYTKEYPLSYYGEQKVDRDSAEDSKETDR